MATRLFRSIVVFGTTFGAGAVVASSVVLDTGCAEEGDTGDHPDAGWGIIDAPMPCVDGACPDAWYVPIFDAGWGIIDAALPDAEPPPDAPPLPDAAVAPPVVEEAP